MKLFLGFFLNKLILLFVLCFSSFSFADESSYHFLRENNKPGIYVNFYNSLFLSHDTEFFRTKQTYPHFLGAGLGYKSHNTYQGRNLANKFGIKNLEVKSDMGFIYSLQQRHFYLKFLEAYLKIDFEYFSFSAGRKKFVWSLDDIFWHRGFWGSRFQWDLLKPERQGYLGAFFDTALFDNKLHLTFFYSPFYIPEAVTDPVANFESKEDELNHPWAQGTLREIRLSDDKKTYVKYSIALPDIQDTILKTSLGARVRIDQDRYSLTTSYAYKPMNQAFVASQISIDATDVNAPIVIDVEPFFFHHHIFSTELEFKNVFNHINAWFSLNYDKPVVRYPQYIQNPDSDLWNIINYNLSSADQWGYQVSEPSFYFSSYLSYQYEKRFEVYLAGTYLLIDRFLGVGPQADNAAPASVAGSYFSSDDGLINIPWQPRHRYLTAIKGGLNINLKKSLGFFSDLNVGSFLLYDFLQKGLIANTVINCAVGSSFQFDLHIDLIGFLSEETQPITEGFISEFRSNDRVYGVLRYVF